MQPFAIETLDAMMKRILSIFATRKGTEAIDMRRLGVVLAAAALASCWRANGVAPLPQELADRRAPETTPTYTQLYSFGPLPDANSPTSDLTPFSGRLIGTTYGGGMGSTTCKRGCGTVYEINPGASDGSSGQIEVVLHGFRGGEEDGAVPEDGVSLHGGKVYGTTFFGGTKSANCVYESRVRNRVRTHPDGNEQSGDRPL